MSKMAKFCIFEKHGGVCEKYNSYCHLGACPYEDIREFELVETAAIESYGEDVLASSIYSADADALRYLEDIYSKNYGH